MGKFSDQVDAFARKVELRLKVIAQESTQETASIAQQTIYEGGRMRIKTGFLRASIQGALGTMPRGPTTGKKKKKYPIGSQAAGTPLSVTLLRWNPLSGEKVFIGWTANYARIRESKDGYLRGAVERWDQTVYKTVRKVEAGFG